MNQSETTSAAGGGETGLRKALNDAVFSIDGIGGAATPTPKLLRILADHLDGIRRIENVPGYARSLRGRADFLDEAALAARAALAAPTAKGGTEDWRDDPSADERWNAGLDFGMQQLCAKLGVDPQDVSWDAATETVDGDVRSVIGNILTQWAGDEWQDAPTRLASPPPPAGAAGGGSGDLGALSAGAGIEGLCIRNPAPNAAAPSVPGPGYRVMKASEITGVPRAPTPDLGAQGEPVAWAFELAHSRYPGGEFGDYRQALSRHQPNCPGTRNVRPLYEAPAAPRTGSGVSVEEIARTIVTHAYGKLDGSLKAARAVLALIAQAPRDGGETQGGWKPIETAPKDGTKFDAWAVHPATGSMGVRFADVQMRGDGSGFGVVVHRPKAHWEYLEDDGPIFPAWKLTHWRVTPTPPSGVETIRQDTSGGL